MLKKLTILSYSQVHPRLRGEYQVKECWQNKEESSPQHTRGIRERMAAVNEAFRFTPAYAGNTQNHQLCGLPYQVHPRIRGEYQYLDAFGITSPGSPPLSRGIQVLSHLAILSHRFTPAFAGNTSLEQDSRLEPKVHPRLRGEKIERKLLHLRVAATHPRLRGEDFTILLFNYPHIGSPPLSRGK